MSGMYLYCQNTDCGTYLGSLGGDECNVCGWTNPEPAPDADAEQTQRASQAAQGSEHG